MDIVLHVFGAILMILVPTSIGILLLNTSTAILICWMCAIVTSAFWFFREVFQAKDKYKKWVFPGDRDWSGRKSWEAYAPMAASVVTSAIITGWLLIK